MNRKYLTIVGICMFFLLMCTSVACTAEIPKEKKDISTENSQEKRVEDTSSIYSEGDVNIEESSEISETIDGENIDSSNCTQENSDTVYDENK